MFQITLNEAELEIVGQAVANYAEETRNYNKRNFPDNVVRLTEEEKDIQRLILKIHQSANQ